MCNTIKLSEIGETSITFCPRCRNFYIWQQSFLLTFDDKQFYSFLKEMKAKKNYENFYTFPDGVDRVMLTTPLIELSLTFTYLDWNNFLQSLEESQYMVEVHHILGTLEY